MRLPLVVFGSHCCEILATGLSDTPIGKANAVLRELFRSVVAKWGFEAPQTMFPPIFNNAAWKNKRVCGPQTVRFLIGLCFDPHLLS